jgi:hypothetical protein
MIRQLLIFQRVEKSKLKHILWQEEAGQRIVPWKNLGRILCTSRKIV